MTKTFKVIKDRVQVNRLDSMFYKSSDFEPLRVVSYAGRKWEISAYGEVRLDYQDRRYYCMSEISEIQTDFDIEKELKAGRLEILNNNWYEIRPVEPEHFNKYVEWGLYDEVYGDPYELDEGILETYLSLEETHRKMNGES